MNDFVAHWTAERIPFVGVGENFGPCSTMGVLDSEGLMAAGAVYHAYRPAFRGLEISFAMRPGFYLSRSAISALLRYPFAELNCVRVTAVTPLKATSTRQFLEKLGFKREGVLRRAFGTDDAVVYGMLAKEWARSLFNVERRRDVPPLRAVGLRHGQVHQDRSAA